ncbi:MAG: peroxiredoxin, partial [Bacteroidota bacterium]
HLSPCRRVPPLLDIQDVVYNEDLNAELVVGDSVSYRATYLIDEEGTVFHEGINHMPVGRNVQEFLRLIDAYSHVQTHGEVCPANWEEGKDAMSANRQGTAEYLAAH